MINYYSVIGIIAGFIAFVSYIYYIVSIVRKRTIPNRLSWWTWAVLGIVIWLSYFFSGARESLWVPLSEVIGPLFVALLSIKYGEGGWTTFDLKCLGGIIFALLLWKIFNSPVIALVAGLTIDLFAALPTVKKSYYYPSGENKIAWILVTFASILNIFAISRWSFSLLIHPIYYSFVTGTILVALFISPHGRQSI